MVKVELLLAAVNLAVVGLTLPNGVASLQHAVTLNCSCTVGQLKAATTPNCTLQVEELCVTPPCRVTFHVVFLVNESEIKSKAWMICFHC